MATLINKTNPAIRITAPEITTEDAPYNNHPYVYWIPAINEMYNPIDWTLVEEEPENSEKQKKPNSELLKEFNKGFWQALMWGKEGYEISPNGKVRALNQNEIDEPVDLEKELQAFLCNYDYEFDDDAIAYDIARHFYELGRIAVFAQIEQNKALADMYRPKEKEE